jgi:hypothetical protein
VDGPRWEHHTSPEWNTNTPIPLGWLPNGLLVFSSYQLRCPTLIPGSFPNSIRRLWLGRVCKQPLSPSVLPASLEQLEMIIYPFPLKVGVLPANLRCLAIKQYNSLLEVNVLPLSLDMLLLEVYDQPLEPGVLPQSLTTFVASEFRRRLFKNALPPNLQILELDSFNWLLLPGVLPPSLRTLKCPRFNRTLDAGVLPPSLEYLRMGRVLLQPLSLPDTLISLDMVLFYRIPPTSLPQQLQHLRLRSSTFHDYGDMPLMDAQDESIAIPSHLSTFTFDDLNAWYWIRKFKLPAGMDLNDFSRMGAAWVWEAESTARPASI